MATSTYGSPYVESSDLVSGWPAASSNVADRIDDVSIKGNGLNNQAGTTYTTVLTDAGKAVVLDNASAVTVTIPPNSSVAYETGSVVKFINLGAGTVTLSPGSGVTLNGSDLTIATNKASAACKVATDEWVVLPFSGGVGSAVISDTPTGSYTGYDYWTYTASGTLTVTTAGFADVLVVGGGGGGSTGDGGTVGGSGGGAGGHLAITNAFLPTGSLTVTVGAGGAATDVAGAEGLSGIASRIGSYFSPGGGGGSRSTNVSLKGDNGGSGGGAGRSGTGGSGISGLGNDGAGADASYGGGGGGGAGAAGTAGASNSGGAGGNGAVSSITGSSVTRSGGGGGAAGSAGTVGAGGSGGGGDGGKFAGSAAVAGSPGTGGGGGGGATTGTPTGKGGGSGVVIIRVAV